MEGSTVAAEAALSLSSPMDNFTIVIDHSNGASTAYSVVNPLPQWNVPADWWNGGATVTLRDAAGATVATSFLNFGPGQQLTELASDRFPQIHDGFVGSLQFSTGGSEAKLRAAAIRYDNADRDVLTTLPVVQVTTNPDLEINNPAHRAIGRLQQSTLYFPHVADGGTYQSTFLLVNPSPAPVTATLEFFASDGSPLALPIGGVLRTQYPVQLAAQQVARIATDGSSASIKWGWARAVAAERIYWHAFGGSVVLQTIQEGRITSEAGVPASIPASNVATYVDATGSAEAGIAVANPGSTPRR
jgi:hypothetical protein